MSRFYFLLWLRWAVRLSVCSFLLAGLFSFTITLVLYLIQGMPSVDANILKALSDLFEFWFYIGWSFTLLLALFRSLKYIFNKCIGGYKLKLLECTSIQEQKVEFVEEIGYGNLLRVWRKWFLTLIWLVGSVMILALVTTHLFSSYSGVFEWFNIYWLFGFILISGYFSFMLMASKCKWVKVIKC